MKLLLISVTGLLCLSMVLAEETEKKTIKDSDKDELDVVDLAEEDAESESSDAQRKRDSGYSYSRPDRLSSSRYASSGVRGRIIGRYPTQRPFSRYGPPKHTTSSQYSGGQRQQYRRPQHQHGGFGGQVQQEVPSPIRNYDFVEPSPIAGQNNVPFNSNAANYLPPRNQKLPGYSNTQQFSNQQQQSTQLLEEHQVQDQQSFNGQHQSQQLLQGQFSDQQQISDAALFLAQNAQAISQLYESPATNLNYEPFQESQVGQADQQLQDPNNQFQTFGVSTSSPEGLDDGRFQGPLPSYASGFLDSQQTLEQVQSLEKDRLISQLQRALAQGNHQDGSAASTSGRYAQNQPTGSYLQSQSLLASIGTQINPSVGPQLDRPGGFTAQRPFPGGNSGFGQPTFLPAAGTTASGLPVTYGLPSTTPASQSPTTTTTTAVTSTTSSSPPPQRPPQGATGDGTSQVGTSATAPGTSLTFPFPQYGGFVPTLIGTNLLASYPTYGTTFIGSGSSHVTPVQSSGSSPTHFGLPIPTVPANAPGSSVTSGHPTSQKPQTPTHQQPPHPSNPVHTLPLQPVQPIHPIPATPLFPVAPPVTQVHPVQGAVPVASGHPTYGLLPAGVNPLVIKPVKYPVYYYPNVYQIQKPAVSTLPWNYAPSYAQAKPQQIWK